MPKTPAEIQAWLNDRIPEIETSMATAEAEGSSDYDYYEGLYDAYSIVLGLLTHEEVAK
jgi:hypothetical protein